MTRSSFRMPIVALLWAVLTLVGCGTRSISDSGFHADSDRGYGQRSSPFYKGELNEFDVLGIDVKLGVTEEDIQKALSARTRVTLAKGSTLMLIQSGALVPDEEMVRGLERYYNVRVFSGVPADGAGSAGSYARSLRLAAAKGGADALVVYWGLLETGREDLATKAVSWLPFVGGSITDETKRMRIRIKVAVVDVRSGQWDVFSPEPFDDTGSSGRYTRQAADQAQVATLKTNAYKAATEDVVKRFAR